MSLKRFRRRRALKNGAHPARPKAAATVAAPSVQIVPVAPLRLEQPSAPPIPGPSELLAHFLNGRTANTLAAYRRDLTAFADYIGSRGGNSSLPGSLGGLLMGGPGPANGLALGWLNAMTEEGLASSTRARRLGTLRSFVKLARMLGVVTWALDVSGPHVQNYRDTRGPALDALHKMLATCGEDREGKRNRVILLFLTALGLRRSELISLRLKDLDRDGRRVHVVGKGGREVWMTIPEAVFDVLNVWLDYAVSNAAQIHGRPLLAGHEDDPLVCSFNPRCEGAPISKQGLNKIVQAIGKRAGVRAWPHGLRHAGITLGLGEHDIRDVRRFSRHAKVDTVILYDDNREDLGGKVAASVADKLLGGKEG